MGTMARSAEMNSYPLASSALQTAEKLSGSVVISAASSPASKSSAPASRASIMASSGSLSSSEMSMTPFWVNRKPTQPSVPRLPPFLSK